MKPFSAKRGNGDYGYVSQRFIFANSARCTQAIESGRASRDGDAYAITVGGDDFVVFTDCDEARAQMLAAQVQLRAALREILPEGEGDMDHYRGVDREGIVRDFPLTRLTAALIKVDPATIVSLFDLSELVADTKRAAKRLHGDGIAETRYPAGESHAPRSAPDSLEI